MKGFRFFIFILASLAAASCIQDPLVERNEPEAPEFSYSNATRTSVTLIGRPNNPQPDSRYGFVVYVFAGDEKRQQANSGDIDQLALDNTFTYKLTDLKPGTTYYVRSFISNGSSRKLSDELPISTPSTSKATVSDVTLSSVGRLSSRVIDDGGREVEEVGFVMSDTPTLRGQREMIPAQRSGNEMSIPLSYFSTGKYFIYAYADNYSEKGDKDTGYSSVPYELEVKDDDFVDISDPEFKRYLISNFDLNSDGNLSYGEMKLITSIDLITDDIVSIDEISLMPDLVSLVCCGSAPGSGGLITLDVSRNSKLIRLDCGGNRLESLDVSSNSLLETLICSGNRFDVLVTSRVHLLDSLDCSGNKIHSVDLSGNSGLRFLDISGNPVEEIDLAPCLALKDFRADGCALRELDLSTNRHLESVRCLMNPLESFKIYAGMNPEGFVLPEGLDIDSMIDGFWIVDETVSLKIGDSVPLSVVFSPEDTYDKAVSWRSDDETVAHVSEEGEVFGLSEGSTIVYAVSHGITDSCEVNVSAIPVESVVLNHTSLSLKVGSEVSLSATILPDNATHREVAWSSSDPSVASVSSDGEVKAVAEGTCSITAVSGSVSAECEVTVPSNVNPVTSVTLNQAHLSLIVGDESDLSVVVSPEDATDKTVVWSSSDPSVATANAEGIVVAVAPGTCRIIATCGAASSGCDVVVRSSVIPVASVFLNTTSLSLVEGNNAFLTASISPEDATDKTVSWSSSDPSVATVNAEGSVVAVAPGTCKITVSCGDVNASCNVDVESEGIPVSGVSFSETTKEVYIDEIFTIKSTISPSDATNKSLAWQSSDPSIANVASDGTVTPVGKGVATITATAPSGISASFTCDVVSEAPYFPDEVFRTYVFSKFDSNKDGFLSRSEAKNVTSIGLYGQKISSLEGIASFDHLTKLSCTANRITSLDLSSNKLLEVLYCGQNALEKLNISENYYLRILACNLNHLNNLDVSNNILLEELDCS
ncbi:MAG: Ig-like domain-containing protein, partial [Bacteroidales bacterium]|nr:Ig-like domain-containing protein [Bacteroidales bacterium]